MIKINNIYDFYNKYIYINAIIKTEYRNKNLVIKIDKTNSVVKKNQFTNRQWELEILKMKENNIWDNYGYGSKNIFVGILDDGISRNKDVPVLEKLSEEVSEYSRNILYKENNWWNDSSDHGTSVAGIIASRGNLLYGIAPETSLVSIKILGDNNMIEQDIAFKYRTDIIDIYNYSAGIIQGLVRNLNNYKIESSIQLGTYLGRNKKGCIYVCAVGNENNELDYIAWESLLNLVEVFCIGSIGSTKHAAYYNDTGTALLCCIPGGDVNNQLLTTLSLLGLSEKQGSSFSAPMASGCISLLLSVYSDLTWREVKHLISISCDVIDEDNSADNINSKKNIWKNNGNGLPYNINYGYGLLNMYRLMINATNYINSGNRLGPELNYTFNSMFIDEIEYNPINDNFAEIVIPVEFDNGKIEINNIETVQLCFDLKNYVKKTI
jgi:subtilisin family serine protease